MMQKTRASPPPPSASEKAVERFPAGIPSVYADLVGDVLYGINTSKLVFSVETGVNTDARPQLIVTLPTPALVHLALNVLRDLSSQQAVGEARERALSYLALISKIPGQEM